MQRQQQEQEQRQEQRRNTGISLLRRQSAPSSVEMTFVMGGEREQATARTRTTARTRAGWENVYIPTLATIRPSRRWGTQAHFGWVRRDNDNDNDNSNSNSNSNDNATG